jgi:hypothetical protein
MDTMNPESQGSLLTNMMMASNQTVCEEKKLLTASYALRSREFSDAVAQLGLKHAQTGMPCQDAMEEATRLHALCDSARAQLEKHVAEHGCGSSEAGGLSANSTRTDKKQARSGGCQRDLVLCAA